MKMLATVVLASLLQGIHTHAYVKGEDDRIQIPARFEKQVERSTGLIMPDAKWVIENGEKVRKVYAPTTIHFVDDCRTLVMAAHGLYERDTGEPKNDLVQFAPFADPNGKIVMFRLSRVRVLNRPSGPFNQQKYAARDRAVIKLPAAYEGCIPLKSIGLTSEMLKKYRDQLVSVAIKYDGDKFQGHRMHIGFSDVTEKVDRNLPQFSGYHRKHIRFHVGDIVGGGSGGTVGIILNGELRYAGFSIGSTVHAKHIVAEIRKRGLLLRGTEREPHVPEELWLQYPGYWMPLLEGSEFEKDLKTP